MILKLLRVSSWLKNSFVIAPLIYSMNIFNSEALIQAVIAFFVYSFTSSSLYIVNDIVDREKDLLHPRKKNRPIASGKIAISSALIISISLMISAVLGACYLNTTFLMVLGIFIANNLIYSYYWKHVNLLDSFSIGISFVLRTIGGCVAIAVVPSSWIIIMTFTLSLFLIFIKRKSEIMMLKDKAVHHRKVLRNYTVEQLNLFIVIAATITITAYVLYSINKEVTELLGTELLVYSSFFVFLGVFRFLQLSFTDEYDQEGDPTTLIVKDRFSQFNLVAYLIFIIAIIYF